MRSVSPLIAAGLALAVAGQAFAAAPKAPAGDTDQTTPPATSSTPPATTGATTDQSTAPSAAPSAGTAGSNSSATAGATAKTAPASFTVGESVKDNTGADIGTITSLTGAGDQQMAVIKMGDKSFQVQSSKLGSTNGAAEINMTKAQIDGMLKAK